MNQNNTLHSFQIELPNKEIFSLSELKGNVVMIVNIATQCGFTKQLDEMEKLHQHYKGKPFVLIGVPTNDFGGQTPEENEKVQKFCQLNFNTTFLITSKVISKGSVNSMHPLFSFIYEQRGKKNIKWNFEKFIFNKDGIFIDYFSSLRSPMSKKIIALIDTLL